MHRGSVTALVLTGILLMLETAVNAETIYGVTTDQQVISFDSTTPGTILSSYPVSGLLGTERTTAMISGQQTGNYAAAPVTSF
jgi:hypothetical protein